jgi:hypothetical protein
MTLHYSGNNFLIGQQILNPVYKWDIYYEIYESVLYRYWADRLRQLVDLVNVHVMCNILKHKEFFLMEYSDM